MHKFLTISHCRDILCKTIQSLQGEQIQIIYSIPIYHDKPQGIPIVEITENEIRLTFNLKQLQNSHLQQVNQNTKASSLKPILPDTTYT